MRSNVLISENERMSQIPFNPVLKYSNRNKKNATNPAPFKILMPIDKVVFPMLWKYADKI